MEKRIGFVGFTVNQELHDAVRAAALKRGYLSLSQFTRAAVFAIAPELATTSLQLPSRPGVAANFKKRAPMTQPQVTEPAVVQAAQPQQERGKLFGIFKAKPKPIEDEIIVLDD